MLIKHFVFGCSNEFMYMIPKAKAIEVKVNKQIIKTTTKNNEEVMSKRQMHQLKELPKVKGG